MPPAHKKCNGCGSAVVKPVTCSECPVVSHAGPICLSRSGHPWHNGRLLNCKSPNPVTLPDVDPSLSLSALSQPISSPDKDNSDRILRVLENFRQDIMSCIRSELADLRGTVGELSERVRLLEERPFTGKDHQHPGPGAVGEVIREMNDRQFRASNILVFGVHESSNNSQDQSSDQDVNVVGPILNEILSTNCRIIRTRRIGKPKDSKPRPICVGLVSSEMARSILKNKHRYKGPYKITDDKTPSQRLELDQLRTCLRERQAEGDSNLTIRYIKGAPKIVPSGSTKSLPPKNV